MKVLVMEPPDQQLPQDTARPNGALGPAYLIGALRAADIEADYYDGTVGWPGQPLSETFYNRVEQENGTIRYGASPETCGPTTGGAHPSDAAPMAGPRWPPRCRRLSWMLQCGRRTLARKVARPAPGGCDGTYRPRAVRAAVRRR